ncbi:MAG: hypothetical protein DSY46_03280 [Hydrogenimonas sp.]|nr:MAG: hypothetical protein DSY46_03280 [Hydrogenimonas sp.]
MKKTLVWGFEWESQIEAIKNIHHKGLIEVKGWVISPSQQSRVINGLDMINIRYLRLEKHNFSGKAHYLYDDVKTACLEKFIEMYSRNHFTESFDYIDFLQAFNLFYDYFATLLIERNIELILFSYLPHFGDDLILYTLAKKLGVTTVIYYQSHIPNRLYYMLDMDDYGRFETIPLRFDHPYISIEKKYEKEHFYMKKKRLDVPCTPRFLKEIRRIVFRRRNRIGFLNALKLQRDCIRYKKNLKKHSINHIDFRRG